MSYIRSRDQRDGRQASHCAVSGPQDPVLRGRVAVFCFSSAGELDVMLPVLKISGVESYRVATFKKRIFERIKHDTVYRQVIGNRIEDRTIPRLSKVKLVRWVQFFINSVSTLWAFRQYDLFCFEYGNSGREKNVLILLLTLLRRGGDVIYYPHGHAVTPDVQYKRQQWPPITRWSSRFGSKIMKIDGVAPNEGFVAVEYPILNPLWKGALDRTVEQLYSDHVVILSRDAHPLYLLEMNRMQMLDDVVELFAKHFPSSLVIIKAHPREVWDTDTATVNAVVTYENTYSVVKGARLVVSFWTSAFFQCMAVGAPVVEYYLPHREFHLQYPSGSLNRLFIPSFTSKGGLEKFMESHV